MRMGKLWLQTRLKSITSILKRKVQLKTRRNLFMALINEIKIVERELKMWIDRNAVVYSDAGIWMYTLEHHNGVRGDSWEDDEDYLDNVRSDFLGEAGENGKDIENTELFEKVAEVLFIKDYDRY
jgi:hypothetical protein